MDTHTLRNGNLEAHPNAETINLLISIGETTLSTINSETSVSPVPYAISPHMDANIRIKILTRRIIIYRAELPNNNRANGAKQLCDVFFSFLKYENPHNRVL
jgi:hypothetical protein